MITNSSYPIIDPVPDEVQRPFWSVMIPTHNCAELLKRTLKSVLEQNLGPDEMEIVVIDDCSNKDDPEAVVNEFGGGRVRFFRQPNNVGAQANFTTCIQRSKGHWVHILHGDDMVLPGYYQRMRAAQEKEPDIGAAFCRYIQIDQDDNWTKVNRLLTNGAGILTDVLKEVAISNPLSFASIAVKRSVYEELGGFHPTLYHTADWDMWKRICVDYPVWYEPMPLALYRVHAGQDTSRLVLTGSNVVDERRAVEHAQTYLPKAVSADITRQAKEHVALSALWRAQDMFTRGYKKGALAQIREALKTSRSAAVIQMVAEVLSLMGVRALGKAVRIITFHNVRKGNPKEQQKREALPQGLSR